MKIWENQKTVTKKPKLYGEVLVSGRKMFFFGFPWVFLVLFGGPELFSFNSKGVLRNLEKTKKPKNQNFLEKFWFQVKRWFFLVFLEFFWFCLVGQNSSLSTEKEFYETSRKPKNQNFLEKFWFQVKRWFFLVFLEFFLVFFWFRFLKTKKNFGFFGFLKEVLLEERQKTKKTQGFLFFWSDV